MILIKNVVVLINSSFVVTSVLGINNLMYYRCVPAAKIHRIEVVPDTAADDITAPQQEAGVVSLHTAAAAAHYQPALSTNTDHLPSLSSSPSHRIPEDPTFPPSPTVGERIPTEQPAAGFDGMSASDDESRRSRPGQVSEGIHGQEAAR